MKPIRKICPQCGNEFETSRRSQLCCSIDCKFKRDAQLAADNRARKKELDGLKDFTLQQQSERISQLEAELAGLKNSQPVADNGDLVSLNQKINELNEALVILGQEKSELQKQCKQLEEELASLKSNPEKPSGKVKKTKDAMPEIELQRCERMGISSADLPCGKRAYCWRDGKCKNNPLEKMPDDIDLKRLD